MQIEKEKVIHIMKIEHVAMYVKDLESAKNFWIKYFGGTANDGYYNKDKQFRSYFITFEDGARLELMNIEGMDDFPKGMKRTGLIHIAFSLGCKERVMELTETLRKDGYAVASNPRITGDGYFESCILDFEGNQIELTV